MRMYRNIKHLNTRITTLIKRNITANKNIIANTNTNLISDIERKNQLIKQLELTIENQRKTIDEFEDQKKTLAIKSAFATSVIYFVLMTFI